MSIERAAWIATVVAALLAGFLLLLSGYMGYTIVFAAVALSAAINIR